MPIFDQGYQHWNGQLGGRLRQWYAIARNGVRGGKQNRILRLVLLVAWVPALALVAFLCAWGLLERGSSAIQAVLPLINGLFDLQVVSDPKHYRVEVWTLAYHTFLQVEVYFSMVLILLAGPSLISQDLRFNAMPLYLSRPLSRLDYFIGKLGVITWFMAQVVIFPSIIAYVMGLAMSLDVTILRDTFGILVAAVTYGIVISISAGLLVLAMSSMSRNSRYVGLMWIGLWFVSGVSSEIMQGINFDMHRRDRSAFLELAKTDWRPAVSYTADLQRVGDHLIGTPKAWETLAEIMPPRDRRIEQMRHVDEQYPWTWSAGVLTGLCLLSILILNFRVKSLDRLR